MKITKTFDDRVNLHVWREGEEYFRQKSPIFLKEWTNVMFCVIPMPPMEGVYYRDITQPLDLPDETFDAVNAYHVFEHMTPQQGRNFAAEIFRVLKPGGIFRVSVPDLEHICRQYLNYLERSLQDPSIQNIQIYQWTVMEMIDQAVREKSGGLMLETIASGQYDKAYIKQRYGDVFRPFLESLRRSDAKEEQPLIQKNFIQRVYSLTPEKLYRGVVHRAKKLFRRIAPGKQGDRVFSPRETKEAVRWMYDRFSLRLLVEKTGFMECAQKTFKDSDIPHWERYNLDKSNYGDYAIDPSVYVECKKPKVSS